MRRRYTLNPVKSTLEALEGNKVRLSIEIEEAEVDREIDAAFRKIGKELRLPGFRPGKAPRQVVEARIGIGAARTQAIQDAIPEFLSRAVREHDVDIVATPDVELKEGQEQGIVKFDATCEIRPEITVPGYTGLRVELSSPKVTDEDLEEVILGERRRHGVLTDVDRAAQSGDYVIVDLAGQRDGEPVAGLNTEDWTYEIGRGWVAPGFDDELIGAVAGAELLFTATPNGTEIPADFVVKVQKVQTLDLPELTDEWVQNTIPEFDSVAAWKDFTLERLTTGRLNQMRNSVMEKVTDALAELVDIEAPESMVNNDFQSRVKNTIAQFQKQGIALDQWLSATGQNPESFLEGLRVQSQKAVKVDLALRAVGVAQQIEVTDDEIESEYRIIAEQVKQSPDKVRQAYEQNDAVLDLVSQMRKSKTLDWLLHNVEYVDADGKTMDRDLVLGQHEHEHEHEDIEATE